MSERIHPATVLSSTADTCGEVSRISFEPPYPFDGEPLAQALWIAGHLQLMLDVRVELIETAADQFDVRLVSGGANSIRYHGPFTAAELRVYLRAFNEGFKYAIRKPLVD